MVVLVPPVTVRRWNASPLLYDTSMNAWAEPASSDPRIITPALTHAAVFDVLTTRATIDPSPSNVV